MPTLITGTAITTSGAIKPGATIVLKRTPADVVSQDGSFLFPDTMSVVTSSTGTVSFEIMPGQYTASTRAVGGVDVRFAFNVPDVEAADFADCVGSAWVPIPPESVTAAQDARDEAVAAAAEAVAAADNLVYPERFGAVGDGVSDDTAELQAALDYVSALGGGTVMLSPGRRYLIDSGNIIVGRNVFLIGGQWSGGQRYALDFSDMEGIVLNPLYSIHVLRGGQVSGVITRKDLGKPTNYREAVDALANFAGTAIKIGDVAGNGNSGSDACVRDVFAIGFDLALDITNQERVNVENLRGDCTNGIRVTGATDTTRITGTHFWNYFTAHVSWNSISHAVSSVSDNGSGLIRIVVTTPHPFITGDIAHVGSVGGVPSANGRWTVTVVNATTIDLQGSVFSGSYTSGGTVYANTGIRYGTGIEISSCDGTRLVNTMLYGYTRGFHVTDGSNSTVAVSMTCDFNPSWNDNQSEGILIDGGSFNTKIVTGFVNGHGRAIAHETTRGEATVLVGCATSGVNRAIDIVNGSLIISETRITGVINIESGAAMLRMIGCDCDQATWSAGTPGVEIDMCIAGDRYTGADNSAMRMVGKRVILGTPDVTQSYGMQQRFTLASDENARVRRRGANTGTIELEAVDGTFVRLNPSSEGLLVGPSSGVQSRVVITPAADHSATTHELTLRGRPTTPSTGEIYGVRYESKDASGANVSYATITGAASDITAGARKGALVARVAAGAAGLQTTLTLTGDHVMQHGPSQRTIVDANSHLRLRSYTVGTLPSASPAAQMIYVSDLAGGAEPCFADGTNWRRMSDRTVAS